MNRLRKKIQAIPDRKRYIDFIAALFAIPVMATVLLINISNIQNRDNNSENEQDAETQTIIVTPSENSSQQTLEPMQAINENEENTENCIKKVGPISIKYPTEGQVLYSNPINIIVDYDTSEYCSVVWSYKVNDAQWSEFTSNSISLFNPPQGEIKLELRVQSIASNDQTQLERNFEYKGPSQDTTIQEASPSAENE